MPISDDEEMELYEAFLNDPDTRMIAPPTEGEPSVRVQQRGHWGDWQIWDGYLKASELLLRECMKSQHDAKRLIFPALFNLRHAMEVALKFHIRYAGGTIPKGSQHDLDALADAFRKTAEGLDEEISYIREEVLDHISEIARFDPRSIAFRYSSNVDGTPVEIVDTDIGLIRLYFSLEHLEMYFYDLADQIALSQDEEYRASFK